MEQFFLEFFSLPWQQAVWRVMVWYGAWLPLGILYVYGIILVWRRYRRVKWFNTQKFICLAIDIPENNEQSLRAVENLFIYLAGAHKNINLIEQWWDGVFQLSFSMEIVGIDGYIQFLIKTPDHFRHLVETAVYANYPDAEITEVEDYTENTPTKFPNEEYDCWGTEFVPSQPALLPIKLYKEFEHQFGRPETQYKDPMASLMDLMSSLQPGEQLWYQILVIPTGFEWMKDAEALVNKIAGVKKTSKPGWALRGLQAAGDLSEQMITIWSNAEPAKPELPAEFNMMKLTPAQKKKIEGIQEKISKLGFEVKIRMVYLAPKDIINKPKVVNGFVGFIKQFTANDLNGLKPDLELTGTSTAYFRAQQRMEVRQTKIIRAFKERSDTLGKKPFIMNSEELATLWHFPIAAVVKAPLMQMAAARRSEAPISLPVGEQQADQQTLEPIFSSNYQIPDDQPAQAGQTAGPAFQPLGETDDQPPDNLPVV